MADSRLLPVPKPVEMTGDVSENWEIFKDEWASYEIATEKNKKPKEIRVATLKTVIGRDCLDILRNLDIPADPGQPDADPRQDPDKIIDALDKHFKPLKNTVYERYKFNTCEQAPGESIEVYVARLRKLVSTCEYGALKEEMLRDRIVLGICDNKVRMRLLKQKNLTLQAALEECKTSETTNKQIKAMQTAETVHYAKTKPNPSQGKAKTKFQQPHRRMQPQVNNCGYCGRAHARDKGKCPAFGKKCAKCDRPNHFARVCKASSKKINMVQDNVAEDDEEVYTVGSVSSNNKKWYIDLKMSDGKSLSCQIDTGATCNVISEDDFRKFGHKMKPSKARLKLYDGSILKPVGQGILKTRHQDSIIDLEFQIVKTRQNPLLSAETCTKLGLITLNTVNQVNNSKTEQIVEEYAGVFEGLGCLPGEYHIEIDKEAKPVQHLPRRVPVPLKAELKKKIDELEKKQVIARVTKPTEWISSMVVVKKPGKMRICLDPKDLNMALHRPKYQIPTLDEVLPRLAKAKVFSVLDAKDGFWQVKLDEESSYLTTFWTPFGRFRWCRMPFGISTAPEEYQRRQHEVLEGLQGVDVIADDILVFGCGETEEEADRDHDENLRNLLKRAREKNLKLNKRKLRLKLKQVPYMGQLLTADGLKPDPEKVKAITEMKTPDDLRSLQRFLGMVNYLAKFLPHLSDVCEPLRRLTDKDAVWVWLETHDQAVKEVKKLVTAQPVLQYYDVEKEVTIQGDASDKGLGAALLQEGRPVAYASRALTPTEQNYAQIEKECLAIVFAAQKFNQYIHGREVVTVQSDHKPLEVIFKKPLLDAPKRLQRMMLRLQKYHLKVTYRKGSEMYIADTLSRAYLTRTMNETRRDEYEILKIQEAKKEDQEIEQVTPAEYIQVSDMTIDRVRRHTQQDEVMRELMKTIKKGWPENKTQLKKEVRDYWTFRDEVSMHDGIVYKGQAIVVPAELREEMIQKTHASHQGAEACIRRARETIFWPGMSAQLRERIGRCDICKTYQPKQQREPLMPHPTPTTPWSRVSMDLMTLENRHYLITVDNYSDYWEIDELHQNTTAKNVIHKTKQNFSRHGIPMEVVTDNGPQFASEEFKQFAKTWNFRHVTTSPYHSQANGKAESAVKIAKNLLKKAAADGQDPWVSILAWRNTPTQGQGSSPTQRLMSRRTRTQVPINTQALEPKVVPNVHNNINKRKARAKRYYDKGTRSLPPIQPGQQVRVELTPQKAAQWKYGTCVQRVAPKSYEVEVDGAKYRRNRKHIRDTTEEQKPSTDVDETTTAPATATPESTAETTTTTTEPTPYVTRSGRTVKAPDRMDL
ncbi:uncharacterized protein K02A2.6-like [Branchiostoma floridae]|uniref:Gypsy retrotransposon integrase-like protein 1 n=1 Tax=Branchiostoma floridae TaxID=7739 RepID=A0A9J7LWT1_BRAFL|nr:uncharacterized protein K02A2.6-like [Branchiostoma floridae]